MDFEQFAERRKKYRKERDAIDFLLPESDVKIQRMKYSANAETKSKVVVDVGLRPLKLYNSRAILEECIIAACMYCIFFIILLIS